MAYLEPTRSEAEMGNESERRRRMEEIKGALELRAWRSSFQAVVYLRGHVVRWDCVFNMGAALGARSCLFFVQYPI